MASHAQDPLEIAFLHCEALLREGDKDRYLANLFAPAAFRADLFALHAFGLEIASVRERVRDPLPGEVRLQWWRDALQGEGRRLVGAHPVAAALLDVVARRALPIKPLIDLIDARVFDLYDDPMPTVLDLEGYAGETASSLMQLSAMVLADGQVPPTADVAGHMGVAVAITGLLRALPIHASRGQIYVPIEVLARHGVTAEAVTAGKDSPGLRAALAEMRALARHHIEAAGLLVGKIPPEVMPAFLPAALCRLYLDRMDAVDGDPFRSRVDVPQWRRQWTLWRSARRARKI
ncbi:MAG: phytoene/squalene synthase family protein [Alphaproteobacteria bacterium]